jgi:hypothetical protein
MIDRIFFKGLSIPDIKINFKDVAVKEAKVNKTPLLNKKAFQIFQ